MNDNRPKKEALSIGNARSCSDHSFNTTKRLILPLDKMRGLPRRCFSLVELLVVISIIAILTSLLLPALKKARATTKRIACVSNMKQIGVAQMAYAGDSDEFLPGIVRDQAREYTVKTKNKTSGANPGAWMASGMLNENKYIANQHVLYCPGRVDGVDEKYTESHVPQGWGGGTSRISYLVATCDVEDDFSYDFGAWHRVSKASPEKPLGIEVCFSDTGPWGTSKHHHGLGYNILFFDGSVRFVADKGNYCESNFNSFSVLPWKYDESNLIYYIMTQMLDWDYQKYKKECPKP